MVSLKVPAARPGTSACCYSPITCKKEGEGEVFSLFKMLVAAFRGEEILWFWWRDRELGRQVESSEDSMLLDFD